MKKEKSGLKVETAAIVIPAALVVSILIFKFVFGAPDNFIGGNSENLPLQGNFSGTIYKGGFIVPVLMTFLLTVITFCIERFITIGKAEGKGSSVSLIKNVKLNLEVNEMDQAMELCDNQKGSLGNVIKSGLIKYQDVEADTTMSKEQKTMAIQKDIEEATSLELPTLEQNLVILATLSSVSTLMGLLGTVLGMIRSFAAMANAGAPDSIKLANGISEALINTAFGIGTAALAVIAYNFFTTKIDKITYSIDEAGYTLVQTYAAAHK
jgi:biopolymer transport protein ExbB